MEGERDHWKGIVSYVLWVLCVRDNLSYDEKINLYELSLDSFTT